MRKSGEIESSQVSSEHQYQADLNVILAATLMLITILWLIAFATGKLEAMQQVIRPYLPSWFALANLLLVPITCVLAGARLVSFRMGFLFVLLFLAQLSLLGLSTQKYPVVRGFVTILLYYETFALIPKWNRRIVEKGRSASVLGLEQPRTGGPDLKF
jgi:hypothetical protein